MQRNLVGLSDFTVYSRLITTHFISFKDF